MVSCILKSNTEVEEILIKLSRPTGNSMKCKEYIRNRSTDYAAASQKMKSDLGSICPSEMSSKNSNNVPLFHLTLMAHLLLLRRPQYTHANTQNNLVFLRDTFVRQLHTLETGTPSCRTSVPCIQAAQLLSVPQPSRSVTSVPPAVTFHLGKAKASCLVCAPPSPRGLIRCPAWDPAPFHVSARSLPALRESSRSLPAPACPGTRSVAPWPQAASACLGHTRLIEGVWKRPLVLLLQSMGD